MSGEKRSYSVEGRDMKKQCYAWIEQGVKKCVSSAAEMNSFLRVISRFSLYSLNNDLLIYMQSPKATKLREKSVWEKEGASVDPVAEGVWIFEPQPYCDGSGVKRMGFRPKAVYDRSEVSNSKPEAEVSFDRKLLVRALVNESPLPIVTVRNDPRAEREGSYFDSKENRIVAKAGMSPEEIFYKVGLAMAQAELVQIKMEEYGIYRYRQADQAFEAKCIVCTLGMKYGLFGERMEVMSVPDSYSEMEDMEIKTELKHIHAAVKAIEKRMEPILYKQAREPCRDGDERVDTGVGR